MKLLALVVGALALAACGDNRTGPSMSTPDAAVVDPCPPLALGTARLHFNLFNQLTGVRFPIIGGDLDGSFVAIELYDSTTGGLPPLAAGSFDLAAAPNDNLATCQHCVFIAKPLPDGSFEIEYFQKRGTATLTTVTDPLEPVFVASLVAQLEEARIDPETGMSMFVPGGACRRVDEVAIDTTPHDAPCTTLTDCANELLEVCDPRTQRCVPPQCNIESGGCGPKDVCMPQLETQFGGACYNACDPTNEATCEPGFTCWQTGPLPDKGLCLRAGDGAPGSACEVKNASTSCSGNFMCSSVSETCTASCNLFADGAPGCDAATRCSLFGRCEPPTAGDPAMLGQTCATTAQLAEPCGVDSVGLQGYCFAYRFEDPLVCVEACLDDGDCRDDQFCALRFDSGLGACIADPVCGDGLLGEIGEVCDDGNTQPNDTCSADCQTVDYVRSCATARTLVSGVALAGDTRTALDGFMVSCQAGRARTELYKFDPPTPGRLTLTVTASTTNSVAVSTSCGATLAERACAIQDAFTSPMVLQLADGNPLTISVAGFTVLEEGAHSILAEFVPEDCGDGIIAGREVCDDGNETSNDGCRADCRAIEYGVICQQAMPLSTTSPNTGTTVGAPSVFENGCSAEKTGPDRVYTFTAPSAGTLHLSLDQGSADLGLAVFRGCGAPAQMTELGCSSVSGPEVVDVTLAANEKVTIVVDGFNTDDAGPYTLTATFQ